MNVEQPLLDDSQNFKMVVSKKRLSQMWTILKNYKIEMNQNEQVNGLKEVSKKAFLYVL